MVQNQKNRSIEIHDSILDALHVEGGDAVLHFSHLYIHESEGHPGVDPGTGWGQAGKLTIRSAVIEGSLSEWPADVHDGHIATGGLLYENEIPIALDFEGKIELRLESWSDAISITGKGAKLELIGEATYIEEFRPSKKV
ncbi:MAG: hypothetical protein ACRD51_17915 [Candidatus Acidiferrum sp.]